ISPEDIRWEGEDPGILYRGGHSGQGRGANKLFGHGGDTLGAGRGRGHPRFHSRKELVLPQNGIGNRVPDEIELLNTDSLVKEVERVFATSLPDSVELEKAKQMLKEHEQALVDAISRIADASDGESGESIGDNSIKWSRWSSYRFPFCHFYVHYPPDFYL
ncbi:hypothetical protein L195_g002623, partial [Trifolium pratense]